MVKRGHYFDEIRPRQPQPANKRFCKVVYCKKEKLETIINNNLDAGFDLLQVSPLIYGGFMAIFRGRAMSDYKKEREFIREYEALCRKHGFIVSGCGCCGSPFIEPKDKELSNHIEHLIERLGEEVDKDHRW